MVMIISHIVTMDCRGVQTTVPWNYSLLSGNFKLFEIVEVDLLPRFP